MDLKKRVEEFKAILDRKDYTVYNCDGYYGQPQDTLEEAEKILDSMLQKHPQYIEGKKYWIGAKSLMSDIEDRDSESAELLYKAYFLIKDLLAENERLRNPLRPIEEYCEDSTDICSVGRKLLLRFRRGNGFYGIENGRLCPINRVWVMSNSGYKVTPTHFMELPTIGGDDA